MTNLKNLKESQIYQKLVVVFVVLRLFFGPFIFISFFIATVITFLLDWADGEIFKRAGYAYSYYSLWDKFLDYWWYVFTMAYVLTYHLPGKEAFLVLFLIRSAGQALYFLTRKGSVFFFFPNTFEIFFYFYLATLAFPFLKPFMNYPKVLWPVFLITFFLVLPREYLIHIKKINLSGFFTGKTTYWKEEK